MDAVEFLKAFRRMCNKYNNTCVDCPFNQQICDLFEKNCDHKIMVSIVEKWAKKHPAKTRQSEFLKMFPTAVLIENGALDVCPAAVDSMERNKKTGGCRDRAKNCFDCKRDYWMQEVE